MLAKAQLAASAELHIMSAHEAMDPMRRQKHTCHAPPHTHILAPHFGDGRA